MTRSVCSCTLVHRRPAAKGTQITPHAVKCLKQEIQTDVRFINFEVIVMLEFVIIMLAIAFGVSFLSVIRKRVG